MRINHAVFMISLLGASLGVLAMNRCTDASGKVSYSDKPCPIADRQSRVTIVDSARFDHERPRVQALT